MDIFLTVLANGRRLQFPVLPEKIELNTESRLQSYDIMTLGEIQIPLGQKLIGFSWEGIFPGYVRRSEPYVRRWTSPKEIQSFLGGARSNGQKCRLMVTDTPINHDVYMESYRVEYSGGFGDYTYSISFLQAKDLIVSSQVVKVKTSPPRPAAKKVVHTYTVKRGDNLWNIAKKYLGSGTKYMQIYNLNRDKIKIPRLIYPGQVLKLP